MSKAHRGHPVWDKLYEIAAAQEGLFTTAQAADAGYSSQLLAHYLQRRRIARVRRGVYRLLHFPPGDHEDLVAIWLWSERRGVFSHDTALALHGLSEALPGKVHLTLPEAWRRRRLRFPRGIMAYYADISERERSWIGAVPITSPLRTLLDCAQAHASPELLRQALEEGITEGLFTAAMAAEATDYLDRFEHRGAAS